MSGWDQHWIRRVSDIVGGHDLYIVFIEYILNVTLQLSIERYHFNDIDASNPGTDFTENLLDYIFVVEERVWY